MGDHRATIKIEFTFHGKTHKMDSWINYFPDSDGLDQRIRDFFQTAYEEGMATYHAECQELFAREHAKEIEESERRELERLKQKYESSP